MYKLYISVLGGYVLQLDGFAKYRKYRRLRDCYSEKNGVPAVTRKSVIAAVA